MKREIVVKYFLIAILALRVFSPLIGVSQSQKEDTHLWLEEMDSPAVWQWVEEQNEQTNSYLSAPSTRSFVEKRVNEISQYDQMGLPLKRGENFFYTFQKSDMAQPQLKMDEKVLVDPSKLSDDGTVSLTAFEPNKEGTKLTYGLSEGGADVHSWYFIDLKTGEALPDVLEGIKFNIPQWSQKSDEVYYIKFISDKKQGVFRHALGNLKEVDDCLYESENENRLLVDPHIVLDGEYLLFSVHDTIDRRNGLYLLNLATHEVIAIAEPGFASHKFIAERDGRFFVIKDSMSLIRLNPFDASDFQVIIPESKGALTDAVVINEQVICNYLIDAVSYLKIFNLEGQFLYSIDLPGLGSVSLTHEESELFYGYADFTTPLTIYRYNFEEKISTPHFKPSIHWNPEEYTTKQIFFESKDGTQVPMFITHKKGLNVSKETAALLYGYGGFNIPLTPNFSLLTMSLLESGGIYVSVNLRGGGEYGPDWYDAGKLKNKQNVFDDFISAAEWLIANNYTSSEKLAINGRSNGGLLVGAVLVQRPDLFGAAIPQVGVLDMLRFHKFTIGWCWKCDYGDPENPEDRANLLTYSPYHNVQKGVSYPATLITTSDCDDRVVPLHSYKFAAALQEAQSSDKPILLRVYGGTGHRSGRSKAQLNHEVADIMTFLHLALQF